MEQELQALKNVKEHTGVGLRFLPNAISINNGSKDGNMTWDDFASAIVRMGVEGQVLEAMAMAIRLDRGNTKLGGSLR